MRFPEPVEGREGFQGIEGKRWVLHNIESKENVHFVFLN